MTAHAAALRPAAPVPPPAWVADDADARLRGRARLVLCGVLLAFGLIGGQLVRLALKAAPDIKVTLAEPLAHTWSRTDIVDSHGRLLATDVGMHSLYADPHLVLDVDETTEKLAVALPGLDASELRKVL